MIKRVRLNANGALTEIDWKATDRVALALLKYVESAAGLERSYFAYAAKIVPLIQTIINRTIEIPFSTSAGPYNLMFQREGWEPVTPDDFTELYARLIQMITGSPSAFSLSTHESGRYVFGKYREKDADGAEWEVCWFED